MKITVNPITSDGQFTIGYDADGLAGQWPGNMEKVTENLDFIVATSETEFHDGNEVWTAEEEGGTLYWTDSEGHAPSIDDILRQGGDR